MKSKILSTALAIAAGVMLTANTTQAQGKYADRFESSRKGSLIGFNVNTGSYDSVSLFPTKENFNLGGSLTFWQGITNNLDFSIRLNGLFTDYSKVEKLTSQKLLGELEGALHLRLLSDNHLFNPFITAGIGAGTYSNSVGVYAPVGVGLQANIFNEVYLFLQANYRVSLTPDKVDDNTFYSFGVGVPIKNATEKVKAPKDTDADGVPDTEDECPTVAGPISLKGCPDSDNDGIADKDDACPTVAGTAKYKGCPIPDTDGDGINDDNDACPTVAGIAKYKGCPIPDTDGDGVNDEQDKCPNVAGPASNKGCPEIKEEVKKQLDIAAKAIQFETGKATIKSVSYKTLDDVVVILENNKEYALSIEGHTDNTGKADKNLQLSKDRAQAVKDYFISKGISASRLQAEGYGIERPIADNKTAAGRTANRRVEMKLFLD